MVKHLSERFGNVCLFAVSLKKGPQEESNGRFILFPMKFVPLITHFLYTIALVIYVPFYVAIKRPSYIITDKGTAIVGIIVKLFLRKLKFKVVLDIRTTPLKGEGKFYDKWDPFLFAISVILAKRKFDGITILTKLMKKEVCARFNVNPGFVGVWTSGVSIRLFDPEKFDEVKIREKLCLNDRFVIFYHGSLGSDSLDRGLVETIKSVGKLKDEFNDLTLFLLGDCSHAHNLKKVAMEVSVQDKVIFHDTVPYEEVPKYIAMCDLGIVPLPDSPNWMYQSPLKLLEYLAMKKVVIATNIPANQEIIGQSKCGIYVPPSDPEKIARAIAFAHENREKLREWGSLGRAIIEQKYTWKKIAENFGDYLLHL
jgi:glycosyltransferase involved in cell wall biosynthesis